MKRVVCSAIQLESEKIDGAPINAIGSTANPEHPRGLRNASDFHPSHPYYFLFPSFSSPYRDEQDKCGRLADSTHARFSGLLERERKRGGGKEEEGEKESFPKRSVVRARVIGTRWFFLFMANWTTARYRRAKGPSHISILSSSSFIVHQISRLCRNLQISCQCRDALRVSPKDPRSTCVRSLGTNCIGKRESGTRRSNACENVRESEHFPEESPIRTDWYLVLLRPKQSHFNPTPGIRDISGLDVTVSIT